MVSNNKEIRSKIRNLIIPAKRVISSLKEEMENGDDYQNSQIYYECIKSLKLIEELKVLVGEQKVKSKWKQLSFDI